jgi:hypothetical protein
VRVLYTYSAVFVHIWGGLQERHTSTEGNKGTVQVQVSAYKLTSCFLCGRVGVRMFIYV